jgi:hypothetical protein
MTDRLFREVVGPVLPLPGQDDVPRQYRQSASRSLAPSSEAEVPPITVKHPLSNTQGVNPNGIPEQRD